MCFLNFQAQLPVLQHAKYRQSPSYTYIVVSAFLQLEGASRHLGVHVHCDIQHLLIGYDREGVPQTVRETAGVLHCRCREIQNLCPFLVIYTIILFL